MNFNQTSFFNEDPKSFAESLKDLQNKITTLSRVPTNNLGNQNREGLARDVSDIITDIQAGRYGDKNTDDLVGRLEYLRTDLLY